MGERRKLNATTAGPLACVALAAVLAVTALVSYGGPVPAAVELVVSVGALGSALVAVAVLLAVLAVLGRLLSGALYGSHRVVVHTEAHDDQVDAWGHELAHKALGEAAGGRVRYMWVRPDGSGRIDMRFRRKPTIKRQGRNLAQAGVARNRARIEREARRRAGRP